MRTKTFYYDLIILAKLSILEIPPKSLAHKMGISVWRIYNAVRRSKQKSKKGMVVHFPIYKKQIL